MEFLVESAHEKMQIKVIQRAPRIPLSVQQQQISADKALIYRYAVS